MFLLRIYSVFARRNVDYGLLGLSRSNPQISITLIQYLQKNLKKENSKQKMRHINILFSKARVLRIKDKNLQIIDTNGQSFMYPIEDINSFVIENRDMSLSGHVISTCADNGIAVFTCDSKFTPNGILLPYNTHFNKTKVLQQQLNAPKPLNKRLWQALIRQKIANQAECLFECGKDGVEDIKALVKEVQSGDTSNVEAIAARKYFINLMGSEFARRVEDFTNSCLNYVYAILRGTIARTLCAYGLEPCIGLAHSNNLNAFNLADDFIEPFRPVGDLLALSIKKGATENLETIHKQELLKIFQTAVAVNGQVCTVVYAIEKLVQSFKSSLENEEVLLELPKLVPLKYLKYE